MAGFKEEFEKIYIRYFNDVFLFLKKLSKDESVAEEITSETFFKAMRSIDTFRGETDVRVWLCQIADIFQKTDNWACVIFHRARNKILKQMEDNDEQ